MADYHSPTVVTPPLPEADISSLERLILSLAFDEDGGGDGLIYFHSWCGPSSIVSIEAQDLQAALEASTTVDGSANRYAAALLEQHGRAVDASPHDYLDVDLTVADGGWDRMFQDIVRRSSTIEEIVVTQAFTCTKMRPDGFGGSVIRITTDAIQYCSTTDMLEEMQNAPAHPATVDAGGHETRRRFELIAAAAGWGSFTLLLLIARWIDQNGQTEALIDHLDRMVSDEAE